MLPISFASEAAAILRETILQDFFNSFALHPVNVDEWNLVDFHTVLHLLTPHTDDQTALIHLFAVATPAEDAADICDAWVSAFSGTIDPPLPIDFNQSALNLTIPLHRPIRT